MTVKLSDKPVTGVSTPALPKNFSSWPLVMRRRYLAHALRANSIKKDYSLESPTSLAL